MSLTNVSLEKCSQNRRMTMLRVNDSVIGVKTLEFSTAAGLGAAIKERGLTVERLVALAYNPINEHFVLTYVDQTFKVQDKLTFGFSRSGLPSILAWTKVGETYFIDTVDMDNDTIKVITPWIKALDAVRDAKGHAVNEIYFVGAAKDVTKQSVLMPDGEVLTTKQFSGIRYNKEQDILIGVMLNNKGIGSSIVTANAGIAVNNNMFSADCWQKVDGLRFEAPIICVSRIKSKEEGGVRFTTNFIGGTCRTVEMAVKDGNLKVAWGDRYTTPFVILGNVFGHSDLYVGYGFNGNNIIVAFEKTQSQPFFAA